MNEASRITKTKRVSLQTVGCRLNQYETEKMAAELYRLGFRRVRRGEPADLYIINTCTVTHKADADDRYLIHRAARENPGAPIVVAGCYVDADIDRVEGMDEVAVVIGNRDKERLAGILQDRLPALFQSASSGENGSGTAAEPGVRFQFQNRAWVKVSDGCNQRCSYCILPIVRGDYANRPPGEIIAEIRELVDEGFQELVLTGLNLGMYGHGGVDMPDLATLCRMILNDTSVARIRLSSIEPQTVTRDLMRVFADANGRICRHLHIPLQSGSERTLRRMRRPYRPDDYISVLNMVRECDPEIVVGADVIVGFPGETDDDFDDTRAMVDSDFLNYLHVFSYSDRKNTPASELPDKVDPRVVRSRNDVLSAISKRLRAATNSRQVGKTLGVIAEHKRIKKGEFWGVADNYTKVKLPMSFDGGRQIAPYRVIRAFDDYVDGELVKEL